MLFPVHFLPLRLIRITTLLIALIALLIIIGPHILRHAPQTSMSVSSSNSSQTLPRNLRVPTTTESKFLNDSPTSSSASTLINSFGKLPMSFEVNEGQADKRVKFLARGSGFGLFLTSNEAVLALDRSSEKAAEEWTAEETVKPQAMTAHRKALKIKGKNSPRGMLRQSLIGANRAPKIEGIEELPGKANYFIGNDPAKWRTDISTFAKVKYEDIYHGMDAVYYGNKGQLSKKVFRIPGSVIF